MTPEEMTTAQLLQANVTLSLQFFRDVLASDRDDPWFRRLQMDIALAVMSQVTPMHTAALRRKV